MERDQSSIAAQVNRAALATSAPAKRIVAPALDVSAPLPTFGPINPWRRPTGLGALLPTGGIGTQIGVTLRADPNGRTIWLVVQSSTALVSGNCTVRLKIDSTEGPVSTYVATSLPLADLATEWADEIREDYGDDYDVAVVRTRLEGDTIQIRRKNPSGLDARTFEITQLSAPAAVNLTLIREIEECKARLWVRPRAVYARGQQTPTPAEAHSTAWRRSAEVDLGTVDPDGCVKHNLELPAMAAAWVQLTDRVLVGDEGDLVEASTGAGIRRILDFVGVVIAQADGL